MLKTIHLFRHGQTDWNINRRMQGHSDIPLNEEGRKQALALQTYFAENPVELFISSDLIRAQQTAGIANEKLGLPLEYHADFREVFLGELEGMTQSEAHEKFGIESWDKWTSLDPMHFGFTYPKAESALVAVERFSHALKRLCSERSFLNAGLCTHGLIMRRFLHSLRPELQEALPIPNCVVYKITWDELSGKFLFDFNP
ncbi:histidine phosphatase family protein [Bdellovibrio reynosensis]|uniref:Histidine phosphatase family protein n=1 Tax=Bdellovibrio reynosensis TaxID=2835041 RepID=A0ABY4CJ57_9BACT|nr:histidine phosphatase family protein [Bdellovibrio reynosensis]UOF02275.1 histidine phosphatase family protein [Bdellovibrio reynosensis]